MLAKETIDEINSGTDFGEIAKRVSISSNASTGGLMNWRKIIDMPELFEKALEKKSIGFISEPLESGSGFHILKLEDKRGEFVKFEDQWQSRHILLIPSAIRNEEETEKQLNEIRQRIIEFGGYLTVIKSTENIKSSSEIFTIDPIKFKISQNIKKSFDPKRIFNPGKMYTGI